MNYRLVLRPEGLDMVDDTPEKLPDLLPVDGQGLLRMKLARSDLDRLILPWLSRGTPLTGRGEQCEA
jgi:hypothetical protein